LAEKVSAVAWLKDNPEGFGIVGDEIDNDDNIAIAVRKGDALKEDFNKALAEIRQNGTLAKIEQANFGQ
jgi:polar amino acid transport system substrate-binding protein